MNTTAEQHLVKAKEYVGRGEEFYRKAAQELSAARGQGASVREMAAAIGRGRTWVQDLLTWAESGSSETPFTGKEQSQARSVRAAKQVLREADDNKLDELLTDPDVRKRVSASIDRVHPATTTRVPGPAPDESVGFALEMATPSSKLKQAIGQFADAWDKHVESASDEERSVVLDDVAIAYSRLQMIVSEGVFVGEHS